MLMSGCRNTNKKKSIPLYIDNVYVDDNKMKVDEDEIEMNENVIEFDDNKIEIEMMNLRLTLVRLRFMIFNLRGKIWFLLLVLVHKRNLSHEVLINQ